MPQALSARTVSIDARTNTALLMCSSRQVLRLNREICDFPQRFVTIVTHMTPEVDDE
jgi:hypothetical protein